MFASIALSVSIALGGQTAPQSRPQEPTQLEDVTVEAQRLGEVVRNFMGEVAAPARNRGLARWPGYVCVGVVNLKGEAGQYLADRVSTVAMDLGLVPGDPGCTPNILIMATDDGDGVARYLAESRRRMMVVGGSGMDRGYAELEAFQHSTLPVRWWHVSMPVNADTGERAVRLPGDESAPTVSKFAASRLQSPLRDDLQRVFVIVDVAKAENVTFTQLADFVAMVSLTQVDPDADTADFDTILNAFTDADAPASLTSWDMDYLKALYQSDSNRQNVRARDSAVADQMVRSRRAAD